MIAHGFQQPHTWAAFAWFAIYRRHCPLCPFIANTNTRYGWSLQIPYSGAELYRV